MEYILKRVTQELTSIENDVYILVLK